MGNIEKAFETTATAEPVRAKPTQSSPDLIHRLELACVGSCTCNMKTSAFEFHAERCPYRLYTEAIVELARQDPNRMRGSELEFLNESGERVVVSASISSPKFATLNVTKGGRVDRRLLSRKEFEKMRDVMNMVRFED